MATTDTAPDNLTPAQWQAMLAENDADKPAARPALTPLGAPPQPNPPAAAAAPALPTVGGGIPDLTKPTRQDSNANTKLQYQAGLPQVTAKPFTPEWAQQQEDLAHYKHLHPLGSDISAMPGVGGKILHGLARVGNIAGDILAPGITANIPGSDLYNRGQEHGFQKEFTGAEENKQREAETKNLESLTEARELPKTGAWKPLGEPRQDPVSGQWSQLVESTDPSGNLTEQWRPLEGGPALAPPKAATVGNPAEQTYADLMKGGPNGTPRVNPKTQKPFTSEEALEAVQKAPQSNETAEDQRYETIKANQKLGKPVTPEDLAWAGAFEKRKTLAPFASAVAQAPQKGSERADKSYQYNTTALDKVATPIEQLNGRMGRLTDTLAQGNMQSDALVAPELLSVMAGGQGSGLRMNEAEIARIVGGRTNWENLQAAMQKWSLDPASARSITKEQDKQIRALVGTVKDKLDRKMKIIDDAREKLLDTDDPKEHRRVVTEAKGAMDRIDSGEVEHQVGDVIEQGGRKYKVKSVKNGKVTDADPI